MNNDSPHHGIYTSGHTRLTWICLTSATFISFWSNVYILVCYIHKQRQRTQGYLHRAVAHTSVANLIFSGACFLLCAFNLGDIGGGGEQGWRCQFQGPILFFTVGACTYLLATTSIHSYLLVVRGSAATLAQQNLMLAVAWVFPGAFTFAMRIVSWSNPSILAWVSFGQRFKFECQCY
ncbi:hypothetical protein DFS34DRAFT_114272 [Phlyctochytrium arcticum]|nr:hypothetical protein DFS34DRAFT_114272 [Phlyctochytrium arcticum]